VASVNRGLYWKPGALFSDLAHNSLSADHMASAERTKSTGDKVHLRATVRNSQTQQR